MAGAKGRTLDTFPCPSCGKTLPAGVKACQFCGALTDVRPKRGSTQAAVRRYSKGITFEEVCHYLVALLFAVTGAFDSAGALGYAPILMDHFGGKAYFGILAISRMVLGVGLMFRIDFMSAIARFAAVLQFLFSGTSIVLAVLDGKPMDLGMGYEMGLMALAAFAFYVLGETGD